LLNSKNLIAFMIFLLLLDSLLYSDTSKNMVLNFDIKLIKIDKILKNNYKYRVIIKVTNDQIKINRDFPLQIKMSKTEINQIDNSLLKIDLDSGDYNKKYTRNNLTKLSDEKIILEDEFIFYNEKNSLFLKLSGSIGVCGDDFCRKIDIDKTFRFNKKPIKGGLL
ncbi:hypothetical protein JXR93_14265, partial [bacterium]|nr:hypothetical protein [bacterium]